MNEAGDPLLPSDVRSDVAPEATAPSHPAAGDEALVPWLGGLLGLLLAWGVYRPEGSRPFDILDFGEFLPILKATPSFFEQTAALIRYYADQSGRANVIQMVALSLKWQLFGDWVPGWQLSHAALMATVAALAYRLLRRSGTTQWGALAGAAVFVVSPAAARSWIRLTVGEPYGMLLALWLATRAFDFQRSERWQREVALYCVMAVWVLLVKELMAPVVLFPVAIALSYQGNARFAWPSRSRRNVSLVASVASCSALTLIPLGVLYLRASDSALASQYGATWPSLGTIVARWIATLVPFAVAPSSASVMWSAAVVAFVSIVAFGWRAGFRDAESHGNVRWLLAIALALPLVGAIAYAPWPAYETRYAYPYLIGTALLIGMAVSCLERLSGAARLANRAALFPMLLFAMSGAWALAEYADAAQRTANAVVSDVASRPSADSVFFASARRFVPAWTGPGPTLYRLGMATNRRWPPTRDVSCDEASSVIQQRKRALLVTFHSHCKRLTSSEGLITSGYRYIDWSRWSLASDSVVGVVIAGDTAASVWNVR